MHTRYSTWYWYPGTKCQVQVCRYVVLYLKTKPSNKQQVTGTGTGTSTLVPGTRYVQ